MDEKQKREYYTVILGALLHVARSRLVGDTGRRDKRWKK